MAYPWFSDSIPFYLVKHCQPLTSADFSCACFIRLPSLMLTSFKTKDVTLKYARYLKICILAVDHERTILIVSKFE